MDIYDIAEYQQVQMDKHHFPFQYQLMDIAKTDFMTQLRWHEQMEIKYIISGNAEFTCGSDVFCAHQGDFIVMNPCEYHSMRSLDSGGIQYHILLVDFNQDIFGTYFQNFFVEYMEGRQRFHNLIRADIKIKQLTTDLFGCFGNHGQCDILQACGYFFVLFSYLRNHYLIDLDSPIPISEHRHYTKKLEPAFVYISTHYNETIRLHDIAGLCFMNPSYFCRVFKVITGKTVMSYMNEFRINRATIILLNTDIPIKEVASKVGFPDEAYFSRCFKKYKGISPSAYQKENLFSKRKEEIE